MCVWGGGGGGKGVLKTNWLFDRLVCMYLAGTLGRLIILLTYTV